MRDFQVRRPSTRLASELRAFLARDHLPPPRSAGSRPVSAEIISPEMPSGVLSSGRFGLFRLANSRPFNIPDAFIPRPHDGSSLLTRRPYDHGRRSEEHTS